MKRAANRAGNLYHRLSPPPPLSLLGICWGPWAAAAQKRSRASAFPSTCFFFHPRTNERVFSHFLFVVPSRKKENSTISRCALDFPWVCLFVCACAHRGCAPRCVSVEVVFVSPGKYSQQVAVGSEHGRAQERISSVFWAAPSFFVATDALTFISTLPDQCCELKETLPCTMKDRILSLFCPGKVSTNVFERTCCSASSAVSCISRQQCATPCCPLLHTGHVAHKYCALLASLSCLSAFFFSNLNLRTRSPATLATHTLLLHRLVWVRTGDDSVCVYDKTQQPGSRAILIRFFSEMSAGR